jgi:hypothetical protein
MEYDLFTYTRKDRFGSLTFYVRDNLKEKLLQTPYGIPTQDIEEVSTHHLTLFSDFVVDNSTNTFKKCRYSLEDMITAFVKAQKEYVLE